MRSSWESLRKKLAALAITRGFQSELARKMGVSSSLIKKYLDGERTPGLDMIDKFAEALGVQSWELIRPEGELPTPQPQSPTIQALTEIIEKQEKRIKELESPAGSLVKNKAVISNPDRDWVRALAESATETEIRIFRQNLEAALKVIRKKSDDGSGASRA